MPLLTTKGAASASGLGLTARSGEAPTYVEDVFSTYLYAGTSGTQAISNNIALGSTAAWKTRTLLDGTTTFIYKVRKDTAGNYIVLGNSIVSGIYRLLVIKFDSAWNILWQKRISQDGTSQTVTAEALALDPSNNIYVAFGIEGAAASLVKLNSSGDLQWARAIEPSSGSGRYLNTVIYNTVDGFLYVGGRTSGPGGPGLYAKYNTSGTVQWMYKYKPPGTYYGNQQYGHVKSMAHDSAGNVYMAGLEFDGGWKGIVVKINSSGTFQWNKRVSNTSSGIDSIFIDSSDGIYIGYYDSASFSGSGYASADVHTTKLNTSGAIVWDRKVVGYPDGPAIATVTGDSSGGIYTTLGKQVVKHNSSGTFQWSRRLYTGLFYGVSAIDTTLYATGSGTSNGFITELATDGSTTSGAAYHTISADVTDSAGSQTLSSGTSEVEAHTGAEQASTATVSTASTTAALYTQADVVGKGGLVLIKGRSGDYSTFGTRAIDTNRGSAELVTTSSSASSSQPGAYSFNSNGFTLPGSGYNGVNGTNTNYALWTFRKQAKFFDIVTYTGNGATNRQIPHSLTSTPGFIVVKSASGSGNWWAGHRSLGWTRTINFDGSTPDSGIAIWDGSPTSTTFTVQPNINADGVTYVAYIFAHNAGGFGLSGAENVITCGSFVGSGSSTTVNLGFEPQWVMIRASSTTDDWRINDNMRGVSTNGVDRNLAVNLTNAEYGSDDRIDFNATGFTTKLNNDSAGETFIYVAIRRGPMKVPTSGTSVFNTKLRTGTDVATTISGIGFPTDLVFSKTRTPGGNNPSGVDFDRLRGIKQLLNIEATSAEYTKDPPMSAFTQDGYSFIAGANDPNVSGYTYCDWNFKRAPSFFDEVCYTGTGVANTAFTHNLTVTPELMIVKPRSAATAPNWRVWSPINSTDFNLLQLSTDGAASSSLYSSSNVFPAIPTATTFTVGGSGSIQLNQSGQTFVAYLFATCAGVSKVGSYTGTATTKQIDCGFTGGARFVLIKRTDSTGDWYVWDSARGIVAGNDPYLLLNSTAAEVTNTDYIDTYSAGFEISSTAPAAINASDGTFIFLAIA